MKFLTVIFLATFSIIAYAAFSQARHIATTQSQTLAIESFKHSKTMIPNQMVGECSYMTTINTSCSSPPSTRDKIGLIFGDASGKKVYVDKLDDPASGRFNRCSTVTLQMKTSKEPCLQQICLFYLVRYGMDGWMPEIVTISGPNSIPLRILYNTTFPEATLFGVNTC